MSLSAKITIWFCIFCVVNFSCVSIRPATVQLSVEVGERIQEMEKIHQLAIQRYFDMERQKVETFLTEKWEPLFLKNFLGQSGVLQDLQSVSKFDASSAKYIKETIRSYLTDTSEAEQASKELLSILSEIRKNEDGVVRRILTKYIEDTRLEAAIIHVVSVLGTDEPARIIFDFAEDAHNAMLRQRREMIEPIEQTRAMVVSEVSGAYAELIRGQSTITGRLEAASRRSKQQDELLGKLGLSNITENINNGLVKVSTTIDNTISKANQLINEGKTDLLKVKDVMIDSMGTMRSKIQQPKQNNK